MLRSMIDNCDSQKEAIKEKNEAPHTSTLISPRGVHNYGSYDERELNERKILIQKPLAMKGDAIVKPCYCAFCAGLYYKEYSLDSTDKFCSKDCKACSSIAPRHLHTT